MTARLAAFRALRARDGAALREVESICDSLELDARDRSLVRRIVGTHARRRGSLRAIARTFGEGKVDPDVLALIEIGLVQLLYTTKIPDHAAVSETMRAANLTIGPKRAKFVNAVLRRAIAERERGHSGDVRRDLVLAMWSFKSPVFHDPQHHPLLWAEDALSLPVHLGKRWVNRFGEDAAYELARGALEEPDVSVRVTRGDREAVRAELALALGVSESGIKLGNQASMLIVPSASARDLVGCELFASGAITVQGESALAAAELVGARPGERILDVCAAPGGKTAVLAAAGARVVAIDDASERIERLRETVARVCPTADVDARVVDATQDLSAALGGELFDAVLVDAPCSNTGVLAARPEARWRFSNESQRSLGELQDKLLDRAAACVRPGGRLVYSTCSIEPDENSRRVREFQVRHPEFVPRTHVQSLPAPRAPHGPIDGGFAALLERLAP